MPILKGFLVCFFWIPAIIIGRSKNSQGPVSGVAGGGGLNGGVFAMDWNDREAIRNKIREQMDKDSALSAYGLGYYRYGSLAEQEMAHEKSRAELLSDDCVGQVRHSAMVLTLVSPTKSITKRRSSYGYKHVTEKFNHPQSPATYVSNGAFIAASRIMGFIDDGVYPNPHFNFSLKSWKTIEEQVPL